MILINMYIVNYFFKNFALNFFLLVSLQRNMPEILINMNFIYKCNFLYKNIASALLFSDVFIPVVFIYSSFILYFYLFVYIQIIKNPKNAI